MKLVVSPEFSSKLVSLASDKESIARIGRMITAIERAPSRTAVFDELKLDAAQLQEDVYVVRVGDARVFLSFGTDNDGEYVLLLDLALTKQRAATTLHPLPQRNPKFNSALNPRVNSALNPRFNSSLNPRFNSTINPRFNSALNPRFNSSINPRFNSSINPRFNSSINPRFNTALNPRYNTAINPRYNPTYAGPYIYDLSLDQEGYLVRADPNVDVMFNNAGEMIGIAARNGTHGFTLFDNESQWIGYLIPTGQESFLRFSPDAEWTGLVV